MCGTWPNNVDVGTWSTVNHGQYLDYIMVNCGKPSTQSMMICIVWYSCYDGNCRQYIGYDGKHVMWYISYNGELLIVNWLQQAMSCQYC